MSLRNSNVKTAVSSWMRRLHQRRGRGLCCGVLAFCLIQSARAALPSGYTQLECVTSTGGQYLDTEVVPWATTRVVCDFRYVSIPAAAADKQAYCGWGSSSGNKISFLFGISWDSTGSSCEFSAKVGAWDKSPTGVPADTSRHVFDLKSGAMYFDGTLFSTTNTLSGGASYSHTMYLFGSHVGWGTGKEYPCNMEIYSCKIYYGETLLRDFVPARRNSDSLQGLYDVRNMRFYPLPTSYAASYYSVIASIEDSPASSISGYSSDYVPTGWSSVRGGAKTVDGITVENSVYHVCGDNVWMLTPHAGSYATPSSTHIVVDRGCLWGLSNYQNSNGTLTLNNVALEADATFMFYDRARDYTVINTLDGLFSIADGARVRFRCLNANVDLRLAASVIGRGAIEAFSDPEAKKGSIAVRITGNLSEFKGDVVAYNASSRGAETTMALELYGESSIPGDPAVGDTAHVVVTNGATLIIDHDWNSPENRIWDFGDGLTPAIYVAEGKTVTINGEIVGSAGFNKTGPGTLVLAKASQSFSGVCNILSGKVHVNSKARGLAHLFRSKDPRALPSGYTMLDSLSLSGGANDSYIDTGYTPTNGLAGFLFDYSVANAPGSSGGRVMGTSLRNSGSWGGLVLSSWANNAAYSGQFGFGAIGNISASGGQIANVRMRMSLVNGNVELSRGWRYFAGTGNPAGFYGNIYLGNINCDSMAAGQPITVYRFMVFDRCTLLHDFVPVTNESGVVGIYDTVGNLGFRPAANAQRCTAGAIYTRTSDDQWLEIDRSDLGLSIIVR